MLSKQKKEEYLRSFYDSGCNKPYIHKMVDRILSKFGGICDADYQDFYSVANVVFTEILETYDEEKNNNFVAFVNHCLKLRVMTYLDNRNAYKRKAQTEAISISSPIENDNGEEEITIADVIDDESADVERIVLGDILSDSTVKYLSGLSDKEKKIARLIMDGFSEGEICKELGITYKQYNWYLDDMRSYERIHCLL